MGSPCIAMNEPPKFGKIRFPNVHPGVHMDVKSLENHTRSGRSIWYSRSLVGTGSGWHRGSPALTQGRAWGQLRDFLPCDADFFSVLYLPGWGCYSKLQPGCAEPHGWNRMALPGGMGLDAITSLQGCRVLGEVAWRTESGLKPLSCFSSSDLTLPAEPSGTCGTHTTPMALNTLTGKLRQG